MGIIQDHFLKFKLFEEVNSKKYSIKVWFLWGVISFFRIVKLKKENLNILSRITKNEQNKNQIEKWLELQIYIKEGIHIDDKNIFNYVSKKYEGKLIIETPEEFNEVFKRKERKNIKLIETLNHLHEDKMVLFKELKEIEDSNVVDKETVMEVLEKEKLLSLLKMRNNDLLKEKREILKMSSNSPIIESSSASSSLSPLLLNKNRDKSSKNIINFGKIYKLPYMGKRDPPQRNR